MKTHDMFDFLLTSLSSTLGFVDGNKTTNPSKLQPTLFAEVSAAINELMLRLAAVVTHDGMFFGGLLGRIQTDIYIYGAVIRKLVPVVNKSSWCVVVVVVVVETVVIIIVKLSVISVTGVFLFV